MSWTLLSIILSLRRAYWRSSSFKVTSSRKVQIENLMFWRRDACFWVSFSSKTKKNDNRTLFEQPKSDKIWKITEIAGSRVKNDRFRPSKYKTWSFSRYPLIILYTYTPNPAPSGVFPSVLPSGVKFRTTAWGGDSPNAISRTNGRIEPREAAFESSLRVLPKACLRF